MIDGTRLAATEFEVVWGLLGLGERPVAIDVPFRGGTPDERRRVVQEVEDELRSRGQWRGRGLDPDLVARLALLARPSWSVDAWLAIDRPVRAMGAVAGDRAAIGVVDGDEVTVGAASSYGVVDRLVALAGITPGPGESVSVPAEVLDAAAAAAEGDMNALAGSLRRQGEPADRAQLLARMCRDHHAFAQFGVTVHDPTEGRVRGRRVVALHATEQGWYLQIRRGGHVTVTPASAAQVSAQITELVGDTHRLVR